MKLALIRGLGVLGIPFLLTTFVNCGATSSHTVAAQNDTLPLGCNPPPPACSTQMFQQNNTTSSQPFSAQTDFVITNQASLLEANPSATQSLNPSDIVIGVTSVFVNGTALPASDFTFTLSNDDVHIVDPSTAGGSGAVVQVNYCTPQVMCP